MDRERYAPTMDQLQGIAYVLEIPIFLQPLKRLYMDGNLSSGGGRFCVMVWVLVLFGNTWWQSRSCWPPLIQVQAIIDYTGIKAGISVFIRDGKIVAMVASGNQVQWTMWTLL